MSVQRQLSSYTQPCPDLALSTSTNHCQNMTNTAHELMLSEALESADQHQHGEMDQATFLRQKGDELWRRVQAQPSTYMPTTGELAVLDHFCGIFNDREIAQEDVPRLSKHHPANPAAVPTPPFIDSVQSWQEPLPLEAHSLPKGSTAAYETRVAHGCEPCSQRKIKCNGLRPICQHCQDFMLHTYIWMTNARGPKSEYLSIGYLPCLRSMVTVLQAVRKPLRV